MNENTALQIPFVSQRGSDIAPEWNDSACGVACVAMCLVGRVPLQELINEGVALEGFGERGWKHDILVQLLRNHGAEAHREEFRDVDTAVEHAKREEGFVRIADNLLNGKPVIVSIRKTNGSYHMLVVIGIDGDGYVAHDPEIGPRITIPKKEFASMWRGLAIFVD